MIAVEVINQSPYPLPQYATEWSAGVDVRAHVDTSLTIQSLERVLVPTGLFVAIPKGFEIQIRPRSGLAFKHGITVLNSPGTIDADYRGEIKVLLVNVSKDPFLIQPGERIAQMVLAKHEQIDWHQVAILPETNRGEGGFGSTGKK